MSEELIGKVSDFFAQPVVAAIELTAALELGDKIHIKGHTTDLVLNVDSMQIDNAPVEEATAGDSVGIKVSERVRGEAAIRSIRLLTEFRLHSTMDQSQNRLENVSHQQKWDRLRLLGSGRGEMASLCEQCDVIG